MRIEDCYSERFTKDQLYSDYFLKNGILLTSEDSHSEESTRILNRLYKIFR